MRRRKYPVNKLISQRFLYALAMVILPAGMAPALHADQTYQWSTTVNSYLLSGNAVFSTQADGSAFDLVIVLNNTAPVGPSNSAQILTGVYFDITGVSQTALAMMSAVATDGFIDSTSLTTPVAGTAGSNIWAPGVGGAANSRTCPTLLPGGWESAYYAAGSGGYHFGIGASGQTGFFNGNASSGVGQVNYGIVPIVGISSGANSGITGNYPYVDFTAKYVLSGLISDQITVTK